MATGSEAMSSHFELWLKLMTASITKVQETLAAEHINVEELTFAFDEIKVDMEQLKSFHPLGKTKVPYDFTKALQLIANAIRLAPRADYQLLKPNAVLEVSWKMGTVDILRLDRNSETLTLQSKHLKLNLRMLPFFSSYIWFLQHLLLFFCCFLELIFKFLRFLALPSTLFSLRSILLHDFSAFFSLLLPCFLLFIYLPCFFNNHPLTTTSVLYLLEKNANVLLRASKKLGLNIL